MTAYITGPDPTSKRRFPLYLPEINKARYNRVVVVYLFFLFIYFFLL